MVWVVRGVLSGKGLRRGPCRSRLVGAGMFILSANKKRTDTTIGFGVRIGVIVNAGCYNRRFGVSSERRPEPPSNCWTIYSVSAGVAH